MGAKTASKIASGGTLHSELTMTQAAFPALEFARQLLRDVLREADSITAVSAKTLADAESFTDSLFGERPLSYQME